MNIEDLGPDQVFVSEVIICTKKRRGNGTGTDDPIRVIMEVFTKDGVLIAEHDPLVVHPDSALGGVKS